MEEQSEQPQKTSKWIYFLIWVMCILGSWAILPYLYHLGLGLNAAPFARIFTVVTLQSVVLYGVVCTLSYVLVPRTDLKPFKVDSPVKRILIPGVIAGVVVGLIIFLADLTVFKGSSLVQVHPPIWTGLLASFYGAINEEVLLRLFFFTLIYFIFMKVIKSKLGSRPLFLWMTNIIVAIVFGVGHIPTGMNFAATGFMDLFRILILNGVAGLTFGWLYWSRGLACAMFAHFITDIMVHGLLRV